MAGNDKIVSGAAWLFDELAKLKWNSHITILKLKASPTRLLKNLITNKKDEIKRLKITHPP